MAGFLSVSVPRNGTWGASLEFKSRDGTPIDLAGSRLVFSINFSAGLETAPIYQVDMTIADALNGKARVTIDGRLFSDSVPGHMELVTLAYDVVCLQGDLTMPILAGPLNYTPGVYL